MDTALEASFCAWADQALSGPVSERVAAFSFNLYEGADSFHVELVGCPTYDPDDDAWACTGPFAARDPLFVIPRSPERNSWQQALATARHLVSMFLAGASAPAMRLKQSRAVAVGFVDGDLEVVWSAAA